jgi:hypothetical protein
VPSPDNNDIIFPAHAFPLIHHQEN